MKKFLVMASVLALSYGVVAQNTATATLDAAATAMGTANLTSIVYMGSGSSFNLGQAVNATAPWPRLVLKSYIAEIHFGTPSMRVEMFRTNPDGSAPFGGTTQYQFVSGANAWNMANGPEGPPPAPRGAGPGGPGGPAGAAGGPPPAGAGAGQAPADGQRAGGPPPGAGAPGAPGGQGAPGGGGGGGARAGGGGGGGRGAQPGLVQPPATSVERQVQIWMNPPGFIRAAQANNASVTTQGGNKVVSFTTPSGQKLTGVINAQNLVDKITTTLDNSVLGDMVVESTFTNYKSFGTMKFPGRIVQTQGGHPVLDLTVADARANGAIPIDVPPNVTQPQPPPAAPAESRKLGDGLWLLPTSHNSLVVEFTDHIVVIEGPLGEARSDYVIAEAHKLVPNKPIRYVVNTHQHFDHSGGLRTFAAEGATIVTAAMYKPYYDRVFALPHTIVPDKLARSGKKAVVEGVNGKRVMTDSMNTIELHVLQPSPHNGAMMVIYLPKEKMLVNADLFTPPAPPAAAPAGGAAPAPAAAPPAAPAAPSAPNPLAVSLADNVARLKLDVATIVPIHGNPGPYDTLLRAIGR